MGERECKLHRIDSYFLFKTISFSFDYDWSKKKKKEIE